jgi:hypothetical protein
MKIKTKLQNGLRWAKRSTNQGLREDISSRDRG